MPYLIDGGFSSSEAEFGFKAKMREGSPLAGSPVAQFGSRQDMSHYREYDRLSVEWLQIFLPKSRKILPPRIRLATQQNVIVCERVREVIEELEPNRSEFIRFPLFAADGSEWPVRYWYWYTNNIVECIIPFDPAAPEVSSRGIQIGKRGGLADARGLPLLSRGVDEDPVLDGKIIAGLHGWQEKRLQKFGWYFMSAELQTRLKRKRLLNGFNLLEVKSV